MDKPYDIANLGARLKAKGLVHTEELAKDVYMEVKAWFKESAALSPNKMDDVAAAFIDQVDQVVMPQIDAISP